MKIVVAKLEAAVRQLGAAVDLYFRGADMVPVHTLASAAHGVLQDINRARMREVDEPVAPGLENISIKDIPDALRERGIGLDSAPRIVRKAMNEVQNFLKHADDDPLGVLEFDDRWTLLLLYDGCRLYRFLTGQRRPALSAFESSLFILEPDGIDRPDLPEELVMKLREVAGMVGKEFSKQEFYECFLQNPPAYSDALPATGLDRLLAKHDNPSPDRGRCGIEQ